MALSDAINAMGNALKDWSELEVATFTGDVTNVIDAATKEIDWDKLMSKASAGTIRLVAATRMKVDGDTYQFQTNGPLEQLKDLLAAHGAAVESSLAARKAIVEFFSESVKKVLKVP